MKKIWNNCNDIISLIIRICLVCVLLYISVRNWGEYEIKRLLESDERIAAMTEAKSNKLSIFVDGTLQTLRDSTGRRISAREIDGVVYIPVSDTGLFLGQYEVITGEADEVHLNSVISDFDYTTVCLSGNPFGIENLISTEYTVFVNLVEWCDECKAVLGSLEILLQDTLFVEGKVQLYGLLLSEYTATNAEAVKTAFGDLLFDIVIPNKYMRNYLQTNLSNVPSIRIVDKNGVLVSSNIDEVTQSTLKELKEQLKVLNVSDCDTCAERSD